MTEASPRRAGFTRLSRRAAAIALIALIGLAAGCERVDEQPEPAQIIDGSGVRIVAWLDPSSPCHQGTVRVLDDLEADSPARVNVRIIDIATAEGLRHHEEHGLDAVAIEINGHTTVEWGEGDDRRVVTFMHPPGFTWTHRDLRAAIEAALEGRLRPADPSEAEGVRLMDISVRGQSIRVGEEGRETGQLVIQDQIVLEISEPHEALAPGQRVAAAAAALTDVLENPFTPNQLGLERQSYGVALTAGVTPVLIATEADARAEETSPEELADRWRLAVREALIEVALQRTVPPPDQPSPDQPASPAEAIPDALQPPE
ncbi:MAG: hypothetical protein R6V07_14150 [Armatimonadota bacterium]